MSECGYKNRRRAPDSARHGGNRRVRAVMSDLRPTHCASRAHELPLAGHRGVGGLLRGFARVVMIDDTRREINCLFCVKKTAVLHGNDARVCSGWGGDQAKARPEKKEPRKGKNTIFILTRSRSVISLRISTFFSFYRVFASISRILCSRQKKSRKCMRGAKNGKY